MNFILVDVSHFVLYCEYSSASLCVCCGTCFALCLAVIVDAVLTWQNRNSRKSAGICNFFVGSFQRISFLCNEMAETFLSLFSFYEELLSFYGGKNKFNFQFSDMENMNVFLFYILEKIKMYNLVEILK